MLNRYTSFRYTVEPLNTNMVNTNFRLRRTNNFTKMSFQYLLIQLISLRLIQTPDKANRFAVRWCSY